MWILKVTSPSFEESHLSFWNHRERTARSPNRAPLFLYLWMHQRQVNPYATFTFQLSQRTVMVNRFLIFLFLKLREKKKKNQTDSFLILTKQRRMQQYLFLSGRSIHIDNHSACHSKACLNHHWSLHRVQFLGNYWVPQSPSSHTSPMIEKVLWGSCNTVQ